MLIGNLLDAMSEVLPCKLVTAAPLYLPLSLHACCFLVNLESSFNSTLICNRKSLEGELIRVRLQGDLELSPQKIPNAFDRVLVGEIIFYIKVEKTCIQCLILMGVAINAGS